MLELTVYDSRDGENENTCTCVYADVSILTVCRI